MNTTLCYHCGLPVPDGVGYGLEILGEYRAVCCAGCEAVARTIVNGGFESFYDKRTATSRNPEQEAAQDPDLYANPEVLERFVSTVGDGTCEASLTVSGINCGACLWLIESSIARETGVDSVLVNYTTRRALVRWQSRATSLGAILGAFRRIGFEANPFEYHAESAAVQRDRDRQLRRIGISGVLGMQIMMIAVALYFGRASGIAESYERFFEWVSLLLSLPIMVYCAQPFFTGALRGLRLHQATIDIPVVLGLSIAFAASCVATISGSGDTYFEAIAMFVFLLLATRYFETRARERGLDAVAHIQNRLAGLAQREDAGGVVTKVPVGRLQVGDIVVVGVGDGIPVDGTVVAGETRVDEAIISGESIPVTRGKGSDVLGGSVNLDAPVRVRVTRAFSESTINVIARLAERAQSGKPEVVRLVDRIAAGFVAGLVVMSAAVALYCWHFAPDRLVSTVIAVLVIACPCALSLATPAALSASIGALTRRGIVLLNPDCIEKLTAVNRVVFDKTGTLTRGRLQLTEVHTPGKLDREQALSVANALEIASTSHPVAQALACAAGDVARSAAAELRYTQGGGVSGTVDGQRYRLGSLRFVRQGDVAVGSDHRDEAAVAGHADPVIYLADEEGTQARFLFSDELRSEAAELVGRLKAEGITVSMMSGDRAAAATRVGEALGIEDCHAQMTPEDKLDRLTQYQRQGDMVMAVGDGVNDAPLLSCAAVGVAMGSGADLARVTGDVVLVNSRLDDLRLLLDQSARTRKIVIQNFIWAIGYNVLALPLGVMGLVPPWIAVIGMSLSSLIVVLNALRLGRAPDTSTERARDGKRVAFA